MSCSRNFFFFLQKKVFFPWIKVKTNTDWPLNFPFKSMEILNFFFFNFFSLSSPLGFAKIWRVCSLNSRKSFIHILELRTSLKFSSVNANKIVIKDFNKRIWENDIKFKTGRKLSGSRAWSFFPPPVNLSCCLFYRD